MTGRLSASILTISMTDISEAAPAQFDAVAPPAGA
jgi:hypothetical protein